MTVWGIWVGIAVGLVGPVRRAAHFTLHRSRCTWRGGGGGRGGMGEDSRQVIWSSFTEQEMEP